MKKQTGALYQINPKQVNWESENSYLFFNKRLKEKDFFINFIPHLPYLKRHIWLATSGRKAQKWVALSKKALLVSAQACNQHLKVRAEDRWGLALPLFHVGGLAITARAHLSQSSYFIYRQKWSSKSFYAFLKEKKITLCSLVPAQVYDLVQAGLLAPPSLRAVVVGGDKLHENLYQQARLLRWPLLPSYGLTECGSQVATAELDSLNHSDISFYPPLKILSHIKVKVLKGEVALKSESLLTGCVPLPLIKSAWSKDRKPTGRKPMGDKQNLQIREQNAPADFLRKALLLKRGWYKTGDKGHVQGDFLYVDKAESIKILGEKINLSSLENILTGLLLKHSFSGRIFLIPLPCERKGCQLALVTESFDQKILSVLLKELNQQVSPFERISSLYVLPALPLTSLSKLSRPKLLKLLGFLTS